MNKWISQCFALALSILLVLPAAGQTVHATLPGDTEEIAIEVPASSGQWQPASYSQLWNLQQSEIYYLLGWFKDPSGKLLIVAYETEAEELLFKAVEIDTGQTKWRTSFGTKYNIKRTPVKVEANGEILLETETKDKKTMSLHTVDAQTGAITRHVTHPLPTKGTFFAWNYWIMPNGTLLVAYSTGGSSKLSYYDSEGKLAQSKTASGTLQQFGHNKYVYVTSKNAKGGFEVTVSLKNEQNKLIAQAKYPNESYWDTFFLEDGSYAVMMSKRLNGAEWFKLYSYSPQGKQQWVAKSEGFTPYKATGSHLFDYDYKQQAVYKIENGKKVQSLVDRDQRYMSLEADGYFYSWLDKNNGFRIAAADPLEWIVGVSGPQDIRALWLGNGRLAVFNGTTKELQTIEWNE
ncbi:hypothetical protein PAE9249_03117 [Paenibacillus sp. CECT 9249]|uniref:hypothetical protein n=1 Tax=Paenibacillus sp. CECT 9249 TaxID=2845385 RepID=UPI001E3E72C8|nr:hypothetical protein [Paenibacillus sp. CECT 9249]CAH0120597.1 hypothetical protein PAE9249_03117 [Paenibacillus sp. CECT 9249]